MAVHRAAPLAQCDDDGVFFDGDAQSDEWWPMGKTTAEGRLGNRSPRLACLPGVGC